MLTYAVLQSSLTKSTKQSISKTVIRFCMYNSGVLLSIYNKSEFKLYRWVGYSFLSPSLAEFTSWNLAQRHLCIHIYVNLVRLNNVNLIFNSAYDTAGIELEGQGFFSSSSNSSTCWCYLGSLKGCMKVHISICWLYLQLFLILSRWMNEGRRKLLNRGLHVYMNIWKGKKLEIFF